MSLFKQLNISVTTVTNIIKKLRVHGTVANLPECGREIDIKLTRRIIQMEMQGQFPKECQVNTKVKVYQLHCTIQHCLSKSGAN